MLGKVCKPMPGRLGTRCEGILPPSMRWNDLWKIPQAMSRFRMNVIFVFVHEAPAGHGTFSADFDFSVFKETMTLTLDQVWFYFLLIRKEKK